MGIMSAIFDANKIHNFEQAFGAKDLTTPEMRAAIVDWYALYYNSAPNDKEDPCQRLPVAIVSKIYKAMFGEYATQAKDEFILSLLDELSAQRKAATQQMLTGGQCFLKPVIDDGGITFGIVNRQNYIPLARDAHGNITDIGTAEITKVGKTIYTLLERRTVDARGYLTIESRLFRSESRGILGTQIPLATLDKYAELVPELRYSEPVGSVGLIPLRSPAENCVDGSPDAVSVYAAAVGLIHNINRNEAQLNVEFENGESRLIVPDTMLRRRPDGTRGLDAHVFVGAPPDVDGKSTITPFSPALREQNFLARKTEYLRNIESLIGLKRGLLSDVEVAEKTATEITSSAGEYNLTVIDFQGQWEAAVREAVRVCDILGRIYKLHSGTIDPDKDVAISWGNGVLYDEDQTWADYKAMVSAGWLKPEIALGWYFDMPTEKESDLAKIRERYMPEAEEIDDEGGTDDGR